MSYLDDGKLATFDGDNADQFGTDLRGTGWHHVAVSHNGTSDSVYLDGVYQVNSNFLSNVSNFAANNQWSIGQEFDNSSPDDYFKGKFDEVRIWKDVRTGSEIKANMNLNFSTSDLASLPNLVAYYQFDTDDAAGTIDGVKDVLGNHGTLKNGGTYSASEVAVGNGISETKTINAAGTYDFSFLDVELEFITSGGQALPNGDIVITKIRTEEVKNPTINQLANKSTAYWVIRNLGTNAGLNCNVKFKFDDGQIDDNITTNHRINKRGSNEFNSGVWVSLVSNSVDNTNRK